MFLDKIMNNRNKMVLTENIYFFEIEKVEALQLNVCKQVKYMYIKQLYVYIYIYIYYACILLCISKR